MPTPAPPTTRLAPSPTGALHLGNARTFLINWALAKQNGWRIVLRIEDLDGPRVKPGAAEQAIEDLSWLGLSWDAGPFYQRVNLTPYHHALALLREKRITYPCACTRQEIEQAQSAPHGDEHELRYPGTCRPHEGGRGEGLGSWDKPEDATSAVAWRILAPPAPIEFVDEIHGLQRIDVDAQVGDFIVATKVGLPSYQLAVVVDDARQGVTDIVRGDDLLSSTGRQLWLYRSLALAPLPRYWHVPLVLGPDGRRLAKRHGDTRVAQYRRRGVPAERIIGLMARWCGMGEGREPMAAEEFAQRFAVAGLPRLAVTFTPEDHAWLVRE